MRRGTWVLQIGALAAAVAALAPTAAATALFNRQTGQPCAACHTAPPELTPLGRRFLLGGFTLSGGARGVPLSGYVEAAFTHVARAEAAPPSWRLPGDALRVQRAKLIGGGALSAQTGLFAEVVANEATQRVQLGNLDLRASGNATLGGHDLLVGASLNNNPGFQDPWNSTLARMWPFVRSAAAPLPRVGPLLDGPLAQRALGAGVHVFVDDSWYAELSGYRGLSRRLQHRLGLDADRARRIDGLAWYGRLARELRVAGGTLTLGLSGLLADLDRPDSPGRPDRVRDLGVDGLWQWSNGRHELTLRGAAHHEAWAAAAARSAGVAARANNHLSSVKTSISYLQAKTWSVTLGHFRTWGSTDAPFFGTASGRPDSAGVQLDVFVINPFFAPPPWHPGMRTRIGLTLTHFGRFDGQSRQASDNDSALLYLLWAF